jgi:hypothetical protein
MTPTSWTQARPRAGRPSRRLVLLVLAGLLPAVPSAAQTLRPWTPPGADSLTIWAAEARVRFQSNAGDSATGDNFRAYELVGAIGRRMVHALGRNHLTQISAIEAVIDSLGCSVEARVDPTVPDFALLMVHNPYRPQAASIGFLFWFRGDDLRTQGVVFTGGWRPAFRVWWSGHAEYPYECGIVDHSRAERGSLTMLLLRLNGEGTYWLVQQFGSHGPFVGGEGEAQWADVNSDGNPELVTWMRAPSDSLFLECSGCPTLYDERIYVEQKDHFELHDSRLLPSPYASFQLFVRLLQQQNRAAAVRLLVDPKQLDEAIALGWATHRKPGTWKLEYGEAAPWPRWLVLRYLGAADRPLYAVHFVMKEGRWIISDWGREPTAPAAPGGSPPPAAPATRPGAVRDSVTGGAR